MIPFFRKIRKKMADDNKPLKYMRYAIGEIVLVVVGILIALQINNWNETVLDRQKEKDLLQDLKLELLDNQDQIEIMIKIHKEGLLSLRRISNKLGPNVSNSLKDSIDQIISLVNWAPQFVPKQVVYNSMISTDKISLISNDNLQHELAMWESTINDLLNIQRDLLKYVTDDIAPLILEKYPSKDWLNYINLRTEKSKFDLDKSILLEDPKFDFVLTYKGQYTKEVLGVSLELYNQQRIILNEIFNELDEKYVSKRDQIFSQMQIVGDAVDGWDIGRPMVKSKINSNIWEIELVLNSGELKFRNTDTWDEGNWGGSDSFHGNLEYDGQNIKMAKGRYLITLNFDKNDYLIRTIIE